jgi:hypothetical protein
LNRRDRILPKKAVKSIVAGLTMSGFTGWRVLVNFLLPPPLVLTFLLVLPLPRNVRKGLLLFTDKVLSLSVRE